MIAYQTSIMIGAPREEVWRLLSDVAAWPDWLSTVTSVQPLDSRRLNVGSRYVVSQPGLRPATWVVTAILPPHHFVWRARSPGLMMTAEHIVDEVSADSSNVILGFTFAGVLGALIGRLFRSVTERYLAIEAASLKQKVEGSEALTARIPQS